MAGKKPPGGQGLEFLRHEKTGRVHIEHWLAEADGERMWTGEEFVAGQIWFHRRPTLCGLRLPSEGSVDEFADEDLCTACVRVLGEHSHLAFEHPLPGGVS